MDSYRKKDLLYFIRMYNYDSTPKIKNYSTLNKSELVDLCNNYMNIKDDKVVAKNNKNNVLNAIAVNNKNIL